MAKTEVPKDMPPLTGTYVERKRAEMLKHVLNDFQPNELSKLLAEYLVQRFGRNVGEMVLMDAQDEVNRK